MMMEVEVKVWAGSYGEGWAGDVEGEIWASSGGEGGSGDGGGCGLSLQWLMWVEMMVLEVVAGGGGGGGGEWFG